MADISCFTAPNRRPSHTFGQWELRRETPQKPQFLRCAIRAIRAMRAILHSHMHFFTSGKVQWQLSKTSLTN